jgi:glycosyltransferase involved in cell wall biosynthesis
LDSDPEAKHAPVVLLGVAAAWDERKGIDRIFEMACTLGEDYQFHLVGSVSEAVMAEAPKNVRFLGYVNSKADLLNLYADADLHISASFEETFGMTFIEAAFAGTRSIGYAATAVKSTLEGVQGIAVSELNAAAMAKEIQKIAMRRNMKLSSDEIQQAVNRYSCEVMAKKYCDIYRSVLEEEIDL